MPLVSLPCVVIEFIVVVPPDHVSSARARLGLLLCVSPAPGAEPGTEEAFSKLLNSLELHTGGDTEKDRIPFLSLSDPSWEFNFHAVTLQDGLH